MTCLNGSGLIRTAHGEVCLLCSALLIYFYPTAPTHFSNNVSACCASLFTWASTSNTEAQAARDKHNCRSCGSLVCEPCSKNRVPIPSIGITQSVRVCDRCYNAWGSLYNDSILEKGVDDREPEIVANKSSTVHHRRSHVVDELAARLPTVK
jgi:hypothetical protein